MTVWLVPREGENTAFSCLNVISIMKNFIMALQKNFQLKFVLKAAL